MKTIDRDKLSSITGGAAATHTTDQRSLSEKLGLDINKSILQSMQAAQQNRQQ